MSLARQRSYRVRKSEKMEQVDREHGCRISLFGLPIRAMMSVFGTYLYILFGPKCMKCVELNGDRTRGSQRSKTFMEILHD